MAAERPSLDTIFCAAIAIEPAEERSAYVLRACGDDRELRGRVEKLVAAHFRAGSFLEQPAVGPLPRPAAGPAVVAPGSPAEGPGTHIGPYKLVEPIGTGGMGAVWLAEQQEPVRRLVALKVIKAGLGSAQVVARFEAERQALALMDHPNIAKVLDAGTTAAPLAPAGGEGPGVRGLSLAPLAPVLGGEGPGVRGGRPYFVMELVKGVPITKYCDDYRLTPRERLGLLLAVCAAVQHAHQKGVIHRDLKPSNVLVARYDGVPVVKVIDFGVAKAVGQPLTERTLVTGFGALVGTLEYMSPEQAEFNALDVDTRSDLYALGVLLYELLTGTTPLTRPRLRETALPEVLRLIREEDPPRPSTRLSASADTLPAVAAQRGTEPARLARLLRGELDWIALRALEKDRSRRYQTAADLARDVERYLRDEPVEACPPSAGYRLRKFARKNRRLLVTAGAFVGLLLLGLIGLGIGLAQVAAAQQKTEAALAAETAALTAETAAKKQTREALDALTDDVVRTLLARQAELGDDEKDFARKVLRSYEAFTGELGETAEARELRAWGYYRMGLLRELLGEPDFEAAYRQARDLLEPLVAEFPEVPSYREKLAVCHNNLVLPLRSAGRFAEAEAACDRAQALLMHLHQEFPDVPRYQQKLALTWNTRGRLRADQGGVADGVDAYRQSLKLRADLAARFPAVHRYRHEQAISHNNVGWLLEKLARRADAVQAYREALRLHERVAADVPAVSEYRRELARTWNNLGNVLRDQGKYAEAEQACRRALELRQQLADLFPAAPRYRDELAQNCNNFYRVLRAAGKVEEAEAMCRRALAIRQKLVEDFPHVSGYRYWVAVSHNNLALLLAGVGRRDEAAKAYRAALDLFEKLAADFPAQHGHHRELARTANNLGNLLREQGKYAEAEKACRRALELRQQLADQFPGEPGYRDELAQACNNFYRVLLAAGKVKEAEAMCRRALAIRQKLVEDFPLVSGYRYWAAISHNNLGLLLAGVGRREEARQSYRQALGLWEALVSGGKAPPGYRREMARTYNNVGNLLQDQGKAAEAEKAYRQALPHRQKLAADFPRLPDHRRELAETQLELGHVLRLQKRPADARPWYDEALTLLRPLHEKEPRNGSVRRLVRNAHWDRAQALDELKRSAEALADWDRAVELSPPALRPLTQLGRAGSLARAGKAAEAVADVEALTKGPKTPGTTLYQAACVYSLAAAAVQEDRQRDTYAGQALALLRRARGAGYFKDGQTVEQLKKAPDFAVLRSREDFRTLAAGLEAAAAKE